MVIVRTYHRMILIGHNIKINGNQTTSNLKEKLSRTKAYQKTANRNDQNTS